MSSQSLFLDGSGRPGRRLSASHNGHTRNRLFIPDRLRDPRDVDTDVTAPRTRKGQYFNQNFVSMIANVGGNTAFRPAPGDDGLRWENQERSDRDLPRHSRQTRLEWQGTTNIDMTASVPDLRSQAFVNTRSEQINDVDDAMSQSTILQAPARDSMKLPRDDREYRDVSDVVEAISVVDESENVSEKQELLADPADIVPDDSLPLPLPEPLATVPSAARQLANLFSFDLEEDVIAGMSNFTVTKRVVAD